MKEITLEDLAKRHPHAVKGIDEMTVVIEHKTKEPENKSWKVKTIDGVKIISIQLCVGLIAGSILFYLGIG